MVVAEPHSQTKKRAILARFLNDFQLINEHSIVGDA